MGFSLRAGSPSHQYELRKLRLISVLWSKRDGFYTIFAGILNISSGFMRLVLRNTMLRGVIQSMTSYLFMYVTFYPRLIRRAEYLSDPFHSHT